MVKCITNKTITLPSHSCQDYESLLLKISSMLGRYISDFRVFFIDPRGFQSEIQSDADVLGVRYLSKTNSINFKAEVIMSRYQVEDSIINEEVNEYLANSYMIIAKQIVQEQMKLATQLYLNELYTSVSESQSKISMMEEEEISKFIEKINQQVREKIVQQSFATIRQMKQINSSNNFNIWTQIGLQKNIKNIVNQALQSLMPLIVRDISDRIIEQLRNGKVNILNVSQKDQNPEEI